MSLDLLEKRPYGHPPVSEVKVPGHGVAATADWRLAGSMVNAVIEAWERRLIEEIGVR